MYKLSIGTKFTNVHMPDTSFEVLNIIPLANQLTVEISPLAKGRFPWQEVWNLEHSRVAFEKGEYRIVEDSAPSSESKEPGELDRVIESVAGDCPKREEAPIPGAKFETRLRNGEWTRTLEQLYELIPEPFRADISGCLGVGGGGLPLWEYVARYGEWCASQIEMPASENTMASYWFEKARQNLVDRNVFKGDLNRANTQIESLIENCEGWESKYHQAEVKIESLQKQLGGKQEEKQNLPPYISPIVNVKHVPDSVRFRCEQGGKEWAESHDSPEYYAVSSIAFAMGGVIMFDGVMKGLYDEYFSEVTDDNRIVELPFSDANFFAYKDACFQLNSEVRFMKRKVKEVQDMADRFLEQNCRLVEERDRPSYVDKKNDKDLSTLTQKCDKYRSALEEYAGTEMSAIATKALKNE